MNASDLSLIELSGEDDSILRPNDDVSTDLNCNSPYNAYFACSPLLQIPRSTTSLKPPPPPPSSSLVGGSLEGNGADKGKDKENLNLEKPEAPQLGVECHQMKRKKKEGGYNLRKSLAWHHAFFTEEGVLDPMELTMLSGNCGNPGGEMLSVIHEGTESISNGRDSDDIPRALQTPKEFHASTLSKGRKNGSIQSSMPASSAKGVGSASVAKRKILSAHDINRSASNHSSLPRQVASSSLKRPPIGNKQKVDAKESKVSKLSTPKSDPPVVATTSQRVIDVASNLKRNPSALPEVSSRKIIGVKRTSIDAKSARNDVKSRTPGKSKSTIQQVQRNTVRSVPITHSSTAVRSQVRPANKTLVPEAPAANPLNRYGGSTRKLTALSQSSYNGKSVQSAQSKVAQPSGLRMPSPSLRFFDQPKPSDVHRSTPTRNPSESTIPSVQKPVTLNSVHWRPPQSYMKQDRGQGIGCHVADIGCPDFGKIKLNVELNRKLEVDVRLSAETIDDTSGHGTKFHSICDDVVITNSDQNTSDMHEDQQSNMREVNKRSKEEAEPMKPVSNVESQKISTCISSEELNSCNVFQAADPRLNAPQCTASHCKDARPTKDEADINSNLCLGLDKGCLQLLSAGGSLSVKSCESILSTTILDNSQSVIIDNPSIKAVEELEEPIPSFVTVEHPCSDNHELHSNCHLSPGESFSCEEPKKKNATQSAKVVGSENHDTCGNESNSMFPSVASPVKQECDLNASVNPEAVVKNDIDHDDNATHLELKRSKSHAVDTEFNCNIDEANYSGDGGDVGGRASEDPHIKPQLPVGPAMVASVKNCKKDSLVIEPPQNAVPFSDEWLAAAEAAGEEILTRKGGAVQNSPPDKSLPEPGPWSPVKKKNNQGIGPFDCTKFINTDMAPSTFN